jgi:antitoxin MazE
MLLHCSDCNHRLKVPHSCGHRSCPHCQHTDSQRWIERQLERWGASSRDQEWYSLRIAAVWVVQTKVQKWGNSLGVRIPRGLAEEVGLGAGTEVSLTAKDGELVLRPSVPSRLRLAELLAGVTPENIHTSVDTGDAVGAEAF